jgi:hypothetical protein
MVSPLSQKPTFVTATKKAPGCANWDRIGASPYLVAAGSEATEAGVNASWELQKDRSIASINFDALCSAARNARASGHPSAVAARPYGTAALRGAAAADPNTAARRAAGGRRPAAAPQRLEIIGAAYAHGARLMIRRVPDYQRARWMKNLRRPLWLWRKSQLRRGDPKCAFSNWPWPGCSR